MAKKAEKKTVTGRARSVKNLKPFKKGKSGNPEGRPLGQRNYATIYREALAELAKQKKTTPEALENLMEKVGFAKALGGDFKFFQDFRDRIHGKPVQRNELTGANGTPLIPTDENKKKADALVDGFLNDLA